MKRILLVLLAVALLGVAVGWSGSQAGPARALTSRPEKENPVTHLCA